MSERKGAAIGLAWKWPEGQCVTYKVTPNTTGPLSALSLGKQLQAICKILESSEDGLRWKTLIRAIYTETDGSVTFDLGIAPAISRMKPEGK